jgi:hypothetical protein
MKIVRTTRTAADRSPRVVHIDATRLVMLLLIQAEPAIGMVLCLAGAFLHVRGDNLWEMVEENFI